MTTASTADLARLMALIDRQRRELDRMRADAATRSVVDTAQGVLMERLGCTAAEAGTQLARLAHESATPLAELAAEITAQHLAAEYGQPAEDGKPAGNREPAGATQSAAGGEPGGNGEQARGRQRAAGGEPAGAREPAGTRSRPQAASRRGPGSPRGPGNRPGPGNRRGPGSRPEATLAGAGSHWLVPSWTWRRMVTGSPRRRWRRYSGPWGEARSRCGSSRRTGALNWPARPGWGCVRRGAGGTYRR